MITKYILYNISGKNVSNKSVLVSYSLIIKIRLCCIFLSLRKNHLKIDQFFLFLTREKRNREKILRTDVSLFFIRHFYEYNILRVSKVLYASIVASVMLGELALS